MAARRCVHLLAVLNDGTCPLDRSSAVVGTLLRIVFFASRLLNRNATAFCSPFVVVSCSINSLLNMSPTVRLTWRRVFKWTHFWNTQNINSLSPPQATFANNRSGDTFCQSNEPLLHKNHLLPSGYFLIIHTNMKRISKFGFQNDKCERIWYLITSGQWITKSRMIMYYDGGDDDDGDVHQTRSN